MQRSPGHREDRAYRLFPGPASAWKGTVKPGRPVSRRFREFPSRQRHPGHVLRSPGILSGNGPICVCQASQTRNLFPGSHAFRKASAADRSGHVRQSPSPKQAFRTSANPVPPGSTAGIACAGRRFAQHDWRNSFRCSLILLFRTRTLSVSLLAEQARMTSCRHTGMPRCASCAHCAVPSATEQNGGQTANRPRILPGPGRTRSGGERWVSVCSAGLSG